MLELCVGFRLETKGVRKFNRGWIDNEVSNTGVEMKSSRRILVVPDEENLKDNIVNSNKIVRID